MSIWIVLIPLIATVVFMFCAWMAFDDEWKEIWAAMAIGSVVGLFLLIAIDIIAAEPHPGQHYVGPDTLANRACAAHGRVDGSPGGSIRGWSDTDFFLITCRDGTVHRVPNGIYVKDTR